MTKKKKTIIFLFYLQSEFHVALVAHIHVATPIFFNTLL